MEKKMKTSGAQISHTITSCCVLIVVQKTPRALAK